MRVTFIQPPYHNIWEALGIGYIASYCKKYRSDIHFDFKQGYFHDKMSVFDSDIVAFSCTTPTIFMAQYVTSGIRMFNVKTKIVVGGWHVTATREKPEWADQIVVGEGEQAFLDILNGNNDPIVYGQKLEFNELPWPDRTLIKNERTIDLCESINGQRTASFQAHRGCPMNCAFCSESCMSKGKIRTRDIDDLCDEINATIDKYNLNYFKFVDPTFDISEDYIKQFAEKKGNNVPWECMVHAQFATENMFRYLAESNCVQVNIGCESGSPKILKDIRKGTTVEKIKQTFEWANKYLRKSRAFFLVGMPDETREDIALTEKLADEINADYYGFTLLCPYPGSDLYNDSLKNIEWHKTDEYSNDFWESRHLTNAQLKAEQARLTNKYKDRLCERQRMQ